MTSLLVYYEREEDKKGLSKIVEKTEKREISLISKKEPVSYEFIPQRGGKYYFTFVVKDEEELENSTKFTFSVSGGGPQKYGLIFIFFFHLKFFFFFLPVRVDTVPHEELTLILNKSSYSPGILPEDSSGELLIQSPFSPCEGILTISSLCGNVFTHS
jgi:hypothetical protein